MQIGIQSFATRARPTFETKDAERSYGLQRLAATCRIFGRRGFADGLLGHVTMRDPELPDHFWVNPVGIAMHQVKASQLVQVNHQGEVVRGSGMVNPVGLLLHTAVHRARPEVSAVCHAHALHASTWSAFERLLDPITQDACVFFEQQALIREPRVVRYETSEGDRIAQALGPRKAVILRNHGLLTAGASVDEAIGWFIMMERVAEVHVKADRPQPISDEAARTSASVMAQPQMAWHAFNWALRARVPDPSIVD